MSVVKKKSLFDHIKQITDVQNPNYWDDISDDDKKSRSDYMVNRFLSMKMDWVGFVNEVQQYPLQPRYTARLMPGCSGRWTLVRSDRGSK